MDNSPTAVIYYTTINSPIGPLFLVSNGESLTGLFMDKQSNMPKLTDGWQEESGVAPFPSAIQQLDEYMAGTRTQFDLPLAAKGSEFQHKVWELLVQIPYGKTRTYGDLARELQIENASRAVGRANATNPISIIVPCHRVIGASGALTGYAGGLSRKESLIRMERAVSKGEPWDWAEQRDQHSLF